MKVKLECASSINEPFVHVGQLPNSLDERMKVSDALIENQDPTAQEG